MIAFETPVYLMRDERLSDFNLFTNINLIHYESYEIYRKFVADGNIC